MRILNIFTKEKKKRIDSLSSQYHAVYPLIIDEIEKICKNKSKFCKSIVDGRYWLKNKDSIFLDFCHINSEGNKLVAEKILREISN